MGKVTRIDGKDYADIIASMEARLAYYKQSPENIPNEVVQVEIAKDGQLSIFGWGESSDSYSAVVNLELAALSMKSGMLYGGD